MLPTFYSLVTTFAHFWHGSPLLATFITFTFSLPIFHHIHHFASRDDFSPLPATFTALSSFYCFRALLHNVWHFWEIFITFSQFYNFMPYLDTTFDHISPFMPFSPLLTTFTICLLLPNCPIFDFFFIIC